MVIMRERATGGLQGRGTLLAGVAIGIALGAAALRLVQGGPGHGPAPVQEARHEPAWIKQGDRIVIPEGSPLRAKLVVENARQIELQRTLLLPAVIEADPARLVRVLPPLSGRIVQLKVSLGQHVEQGQPLATLDSADLGTAYADYDRAKVSLALAEHNRDRQRELIRIGGAADKDAQQAESDYATAQAEYRRAEARLKQIGASADITAQSRLLTLTAPIAGSIIDFAAAPGAFWNDPTAALMTIADLDTVWVSASVPEKDLAFVSKGQQADIVFTAYPDDRFRGEVLFVSNVIDPDTRRTKVRIAMRNPAGRLRPGMFANVTFLAPKRMVTAVPDSALLLKDDRNKVLVEVAPWTFVAREVEPGYETDGQSVIEAGLTPAERVIVKGGVLLND